ncbi:MAG TPA: hypothetical protein VHC97_00065 [Thermoanaerobaculia bacterium]|jgi:hypothetical protein|nr:hypothetical protein [Thermoanaerobaculia bacterium]
MTKSGSTIDQVKDGVAAVVDRIRQVLDRFYRSGAMTGSVGTPRLSPAPVRRKGASRTSVPNRALRRWR